LSKYDLRLGLRLGMPGGSIFAVASADMPPAFTTNFLALSALPTGVSLTRASTASKRDSSGVLQTAAIDAARFDYGWNGSAWAAKGLLAEPSRPNTIFSSDTFTDGTNWAFDSGATSAGSWTAPDGTSGFSFSPNGTSGAGLGALHSHHGLTSGSTYTTSIFAKAITGRYQWLSQTERNGTGGVSAIFDLAGTTDTVATQVITWGAASPTVASTSAKYLGGGVWRLTITWSMTLTSDSVYTNMGAADAATGNTLIAGWGRVASTNSNIAGFWGINLEPGTFATSLIRTTSSGAVTRSADVLSAASPLTALLAAGPSVWEFQDEATGTISRTAYAAGAFDWPVGKWYRSMGVYPAGTNTSSHMTVGSAY
jgi:hypothetical protein